MVLALSTMWAQQQRFDDDPLAFAETARALGYDAIEISHLTPAAPFTQILAQQTAPVISIHAPAPLSRDGSGRTNSSLNLASLDENERQLAIEYTVQTIDHCADAGARFVVVHLGSVGNAILPPEREMRRRFDAGERTGDTMDALRAETRRLRAQIAPPYLAQAKRTLAELAGHAQRRGAALGIENRLHHHEIPLPDEALDLLADYPPEIVGYWHDVGHAEVQARLGYVDKTAWLLALSSRTLGCHLHDVDGIGDHRAPGRGDVDWSYIRDGLPSGAVRVFEIDQRQPDDVVAGAVGFLRTQGVV